MSVRSVRVLLAVGALTLAAAGCASQGVASGAGLTSGATGAAGSQTASAPSPTTSDSASATDSSSSPDSSDSASDAESSSSAPPLPDTSSSSSTQGKLYKLTDTVTEGGFRFKIHSITLPYHPPAGATFTPGQDEAWLLMDFEVTNVSNQKSMFSTIGAFDLRDSTNRSYVTSVVGGESLPKGKLFQDQEMAPGAKATGAVIFDVPANGSGYHLIYRGNMWHSSEHPPVISLGR